ncbi:seizure 6-like protein isoform 5-T5 [Erethizon dorsatum]
MPAARPPAAGLGGVSLLFALLLGSPAAALAGDAGPEGHAGYPGPHLLPSAALESSSLSQDSPEDDVTMAPPNPSQSGEELGELEPEGTVPSVYHHPAALSPLPPEVAGAMYTLAPRKKLPLKPVTSARKLPRPKATSASADPVRAGAHPTASAGPGPRSPSTEKPRPPGDVDSGVASQPSSEGPVWLHHKEATVPTTPEPLQISPFTSEPLVAHTLLQRPEPGDPASHAQEEAPEVSPEDASPGTLMDKGDNDLTGSASEESQETTTSTIITTTVITTEQAPALCSVSFSDPEGYIDSSDYLPLPFSNFLECTYNVTVYTGYGVELQVKSVNLSEGELLSIRGVDGPTLTILANQTLLVEGQVIRSPTNTISVYFRTFQEDGLGTFQLHYQAFMLSCSFPRRPDSGDVTVMDLHSGGVAHFHCHLGYELQGAKMLTCINASKPHWSSQEPICSAPCGGAVHNATIGRVLSPSHPGNSNGSQFCVWTIEAAEGQKLHLHFERLSLHDKDRMMVYSGQTNKSALLYDSLQAESVPFEGLLSDSNCIRIEFTSNQGQVASAFNIRFEAFEKGHCYEPYIQNGNFTTSDLTYNIGTVVEFTCDPGHSLEQGPAIIECVNVRDPYWNDTEPLCRAMCGGELSAVAGVVLSPNWPEPYVEGEDCVWKIHVGEEKRIFLDIQFLNLSNSDILTIYDGDEVVPHILGQYLGSSGPQKLYSSTPDLTIQFHSDPAGLIFGKGQGFIMNYIEVSRNDSCSDLPEIQNGWKTTSHTELVRGARITYQCDPGYDIVGSDTLTCQWDLSWSSDPPFCEKTEESLACDNPGLPENGYQILYKRLYLPGESLTFMCYEGFELMGEVTIRCILGQPSHWNGPLPVCKVAEAAAESSLEGGNMALAIFIPVLIISLLLGGAYIYITRCRYYSSLRLPLMYSHPYSQITVETEFDNPIYETGETREYEVSI